MITAESDVRTVDEAVALDGVVRGEIGKIAVVNGSLIRTQIEIVPQIEQMIWPSRCHFFFFFLFDLRIDCRRHKRTQITNSNQLLLFVSVFTDLLTEGINMVGIKMKQNLVQGLI